MLAPRVADAGEDGPTGRGKPQRRVPPIDVLERDGLIERHSFAVVPPHVEYALTPSGRELSARLMELFDWIGENVNTFVRAQKRYDQLKIL